MNVSYSMATELLMLQLLLCRYWLCGCCVVGRDWLCGSLYGLAVVGRGWPWLAVIGRDWP